MESVGIFSIGKHTGIAGGGSQRLWDLIPVTARAASGFLLQAAPSNEDIISVNGSILGPGERTLLLREVMEKTSICGPDPKCKFQILAVIS